MLIWIRTGKGPVVGDYPILARGDSTTARGAMMSIRFMVAEIARGFGLDSGQVTITSRGSTISATARGSGLDYSVGQRTSLTASGPFLPLARDSVSCKVRL